MKAKLAAKQAETDAQLARDEARREEQKREAAKRDAEAKRAAKLAAEQEAAEALRKAQEKKRQAKEEAREAERQAKIQAEERDQRRRQEAAKAEMQAERLAKQVQAKVRLQELEAEAKELGIETQRKGSIWQASEDEIDFEAASAELEVRIVLQKDILGVKAAVSSRDVRRSMKLAKADRMQQLTTSAAPKGPAIKLKTAPATGKLANNMFLKMADKMTLAPEAAAFVKTEAPAPTFKAAAKAVLSANMLRRDASGPPGGGSTTTAQEAVSGFGAALKRPAARPVPAEAVVVPEEEEVEEVAGFDSIQPKPADSEGPAMPERSEPKAPAPPTSPEANLAVAAIAQQIAESAKPPPSPTRPGSTAEPPSLRQITEWRMAFAKFEDKASNTVRREQLPKLVKESGLPLLSFDYGASCDTYSFGYELTFIEYTDLVAFLREEAAARKSTAEVLEQRASEGTEAALTRRVSVSAAVGANEAAIQKGAADRENEPVLGAGLQWRAKPKPAATIGRKASARSLLDDLLDEQATEADDPKSWTAPRVFRMVPGELHDVVQRGDTQRLTFLVGEGVDVNGKHGPSASTALHWAARGGDYQAAQLLIEHAADVNSKNSHSYSPLHWAAYQGHLSVVQLLIDEGASMAAKDKAMSNPLHWAAFGNQRACVSALCQAGADVDAQNRAGETALHWAATEGETGHPDVIEALIFAGCDQALKTKSTGPGSFVETAMQGAQRLSKMGAVAKLQSLEGHLAPSDMEKRQRRQDAEKQAEQRERKAAKRRSERKIAAQAAKRLAAEKEREEEAQWQADMAKNRGQDLVRQASMADTQIGSGGTRWG